MIALIVLVLVANGIVVCTFLLLLQLSLTDTSNLLLNNDPSFSPCHSKHIKGMKFSDVTQYS